MKKTVVSALAATLVVGAASTTFAAVNPFSDVPANSWAYNAVTTLAKDGVVNGFPNGTFQGQKTMTRYEMAQIVAKAMAYENMTKADKAIVDKLAVEFGSELQNLGVRVKNLEEKSDNVKLTGKVEYTYTRAMEDKGGDLGKQYETKNGLKFRLQPKAYIGNTGWTANARLDYKLAPSLDSDNDGKVTVDRVYVQGKLGGVHVTAGRAPAFLANGLVFDSKLTGAILSGGSDKTTLVAAAGRFNDAKIVKDSKAKDVTANVYAAQVNHKFSSKVSGDVGYLSIRGIDNTKADKNNIWYVGAKANVAPNLNLGLDYAKSTQDYAKSEAKKAYNAELDYKGAKASQPGSFGAYVAYRYLGEAAAFKPTYDGVGKKQKGYEVGVSYVPAENIVAKVKYFNGKVISNDNKASKIFGRVEFLF